MVIHLRDRSCSQQRLQRCLETFATSNRKDAAPCRLLRRACKSDFAWLCIVSGSESGISRHMFLETLRRKGAVYVRYLDSHPNHRAIWFMFPTLWPQAEYHVLLWFEDFFGFYEPRWDCWMGRLSLWDQDCRQEGQNSLRDVFFPWIKVKCARGKLLDKPPKYPKWWVAMQMPSRSLNYHRFSQTQD